jgi:glycerol transport system ATP-binding protein
MNLIAAEAATLGVQLQPPQAGDGAGPALQVPLPAAAGAALTRTLTVGVRAAALRVQPREGDVALPGTVELAEISGSDTFVHAATAVGEVVAQLTGVHDLELGAPVTLYLHPSQVYVFGADGALLVAPPRAAAGH